MQLLLQRVLVFLCGLLVFLIPFNGKVLFMLGFDKTPNFLSIILVLSLVLSFFIKDWNWRLLFKNRKFQLFGSLFLLYMLSALLAGDTDFSMKELSKKLSFIAIPLLFLPNPDFFKSIKRKMFIAYLFGVFFSLLYFDFKALLFFLESGKFPVYIKYTLFTHPTYLGTNVLIAFVFFLSFYIKSRLSTGLSLIRLIVAYLLLAHLFLILSKAALICAIVVFVSFAFYLLIKSKKKFIYYVLVGLLPCVIVFISFKSVRLALVEVQSRFRELENYENKDGSTSFRFQIVKAIPELLDDHFAFGIGVGQEAEVLIKYYKKQNWPVATAKKYNSHNQFVQTSLSVGLIGVALLIFILLKPLFQVRFNGDKVILVCFIILFCTEAMLERQAGIMLFMIFYTLAFGVTSPSIKHKKLLY